MASPLRRVPTVYGRTRSNRSRSSKRSANLLMFLVCSPSATPIEFVHEAAFPHFIDKAELDKVLHFGFGRSCIRERLDF